MNGIPEATPTRTVAQIGEETRVALDHFSALGINLKGSRLLDYVEVLDRYSDIESADISKAGATARVGQTLLEVADFVEISTLGSTYLREQENRRKLQNAVRGRPYRAQYAPTEHDPHRDDAFELCTAAYLNRFGCLGPPPTDGSDVVFADGDTRCPIECKRITSASALKGALVKGKRQLRERRRRGSAPGMIVVDVSRAVNPTTRMDHFASTGAMTTSCARKLHEFIGRNIASIQHRDVISPDVLGIAFRLIYPGYCGTVANARRYIEWSFVHLHSDDVQKALFELCIELFGPGPTIEKQYGPVPLAGVIRHLLRKGYVAYRDGERAYEALDLTGLYGFKIS